MSFNSDNFFKNLPIAILSTFLVLIIFASGYAVGNGDSHEFSIPESLRNTASAEEAVDFSAFWRAWSVLDDRFISASSTNETSDQDRVWGAISGMVDSLGDPYTVFLPPTENESFQSSISGNFEGVGMEIGLERGILTVIAPLKNTPAERAGLLPGDRIIGIDGVTTQNITIEEALNKIRGPVNTDVVLSVFREGKSETFDVTVTRDVITIPTIDIDSSDSEVFVISLYSFAANAEGEFRNALRQFIISGKSKLVLDLRGNPGGYLNSAVNIASWFLPTGKVVVQEDFGDTVKLFRSKGPQLFDDNLKMVVLVDRGSASASEILAGALQEYEIATLVGTQTFGKGSVQELVEITPETSLKVTIARWLTPLGKSISDGGLTPDVVIDEAPEGVELIDYQLERAIEIVKEI